MTFMPPVPTFGAQPLDIRRGCFTVLRTAEARSPERLTWFSQLTAPLLTWIFRGRDAVAEETFFGCPDLVSFHVDRGIGLYLRGQSHAALADFRTALRLNWRDERAAAWIARAGGENWAPSASPRPVPEVGHYGMRYGAVRGSAL
ncbi:hypothetical protein [Microvirga antarctica]|uniref:hypothetical protein n=1 Tax=Microvirga antarctica TaxID=2819233 RepID=UPI001B307C25|nr:hypothetical protein [Microvirga antarctica]